MLKEGKEIDFEQADNLLQFVNPAEDPKDKINNYPKN